MSELQDVPPEQQQQSDVPVTPETAVTEAYEGFENFPTSAQGTDPSAPLVADGTLPAVTLTDFVGDTGGTGGGQSDIGPISGSGSAGPGDAGGGGTGDVPNEGAFAAEGASDKGQKTTKNPDGSEVTVDDRNRVVAAVDASGHRTTFKYEGNEKDPNQVFVQNQGDLKPTAYTRGEDGVYRDTMGNTWGSDIKFGKDGSYSYLDEKKNRVVEKSDGTKVKYSGDDFFLSKPVQVTGADGRVSDYSYGKDMEINAVRSSDGSAMIKTENGWVDENGKPIDVKSVSLDIYGHTHVTKNDNSVVKFDGDGKVISTKQADKGFGSFVWDEGAERKFAYSEFDQVIGITETVDGKTHHYTKDNASGKWVDENGKDTGMRDVKVNKDGSYSYTDQNGQRVTVNTDGSIGIGKKMS